MMCLCCDKKPTIEGTIMCEFKNMNTCIPHMVCSLECRKVWFNRRIFLTKSGYVDTCDYCHKLEKVKNPLQEINWNATRNQAFIFCNDKCILKDLLNIK